MAEDSKSVLHSLRDKAKDKDAMISKFLKSKDEILAMWESETDEMSQNEGGELPSNERGEPPQVKGGAPLQGDGDNAEHGRGQEADEYDKGEIVDKGKKAQEIRLHNYCIVHVFPICIFQ